MIDFSAILTGTKNGNYLKEGKFIMTADQNTSEKFSGIFDISCIRQGINQVCCSNVSANGSAGIDRPELPGKVIDVGNLLADRSDIEGEDTKKAVEAGSRMAAFFPLINTVQGNTNSDLPDLSESPDVAKKIGESLCIVIENHIAKEAGQLFARLTGRAPAEKIPGNSHMIDMKSLIEEGVIDMLESYRTGGSIAAARITGERKPPGEVLPDSVVENRPADSKFSLESMIERVLLKIDNGKFIIREGDILIKDGETAGRKVILSQRISGEIKKIAGILVESLESEFSGNTEPVKSARPPGFVINPAGRSQESDKSAGERKTIARSIYQNTVRYPGKADERETGTGEGIGKTYHLVNGVNRGGDTETAGTAFPANRENIYVEAVEAAYQISKKIDIGKGEPLKEIELKLRPESLGTIKIKIVSLDNKVDVWIKTCSVHTREVINESIGVLKNNLIDKGMEVRELTVSVDPNGAGGSEKNGPGSLLWYRQDTVSEKRYHYGSAAEDNSGEAAGIAEGYCKPAAVYGHLNMII